MFISFSHKLIFLANMKCASTSISQALRPHCQITPQIAKSITHKPYPGVLNYLDEQDKDWSRLTSFTTIRNPWARTLSFYNHLKAEPSLNPFWRGAADMAKDFSAFLDMAEVQVNLARLNADHFCYDQTRNLRVDHIFRQEFLSAEIVPFLKERGIQLKGLPQARTRGRDLTYADHYSKKHKELVATIFATDIRIGNYIFDT